MSRKSHVTETGEYADYSEILIKTARDSSVWIMWIRTSIHYFYWRNKQLNKVQMYLELFILCNSLNAILMNIDMQIGWYSDSVMSIVNQWDTNHNVFWCTEQKQIFHTQTEQTWSFKGTASIAGFSALYQVSRLYGTSQSSSQGIRTFMTPAKRKKRAPICVHQEREMCWRGEVSAVGNENKCCVWVWKQIYDGKQGKHKSFLKACRPLSYCCQN